MTHGIVRQQLSQIYLWSRSIKIQRHTIVSQPMHPQFENFLILAKSKFKLTQLVIVQLSFTKLENTLQLQGIEIIFE